MRRVALSSGLSPPPPPHPGPPARPPWEHEGVDMPGILSVFGPHSRKLFAIPTSQEMPHTPPGVATAEYYYSSI